MKKRIYIYELDCYKVASEEQIQRMRISPERYFNLEGLPSEELAEKLEEFIWERGKMLAPFCNGSSSGIYLSRTHSDNFGISGQKIFASGNFLIIADGFCIFCKLGSVDHLHARCRLRIRRYSKA